MGLGIRDEEKGERDEEQGARSKEQGARNNDCNKCKHIKRKEYLWVLFDLRK